MNFTLIRCPICGNILERYFSDTVFGKHQFYCKNYGLANHSFSAYYNVETENISRIEIQENGYILVTFYGLNLSIIKQKTVKVLKEDRPYDASVEYINTICTVNSIINYDLLDPPKLVNLLAPYIAFS